VAVVVAPAAEPSGATGAEPEEGDCCEQAVQAQAMAVASNQEVRIMVVNCP
jgi:hypothetical protein